MNGPLACQLLSRTTANAIDTLFPEGEAGDLKNFKELANLIRLTDRKIIKICQLKPYLEKNDLKLLNTHQDFKNQEAKNINIFLSICTSTKFEV